ncbi:hypothetical protein EPUS_08057 [Endocarpon pusillum Z07020]|uniref:HMG box domain-containing protein n=1 Tax=Endocarpon pusillum (strain Z07020 / HMAS-L-300199) TaxID=1263415 RepID=U1GBS4_ENDPU|nr:uncharacterized protein EPUS_08057 [Endocarpon pusillum Z07020]ERF75012.1 hypothetical protein EPUS_08057 [Endocarpon pusillum Z07020]
MAASIAASGEQNQAIGSVLRASIMNQTKVVSSDHGMKQASGNDKHAKIPRPPNAFILYRQAHHPIIKAENPGFHNNDISKVLGKQWKEESPAVRQMFKAKALERKAEHSKMYPDYQYAPRKPGQKKRRAARKGMEAGDGKEQYDSLCFIDQEGDFYMDSESGSAVGDDDMDVIGTHVDDHVRRFHIDGDNNIGIILPAASNVNLAKMVEAHNKRAQQDSESCDYDPAKDSQAAQSIPPHVQNDTDFFEALIDWDGIAEDFKIIQEASGEDLAGLREVESGNPYLSLSDEDQRALFEAELERTLKFFD